MVHSPPFEFDISVSADKKRRQRGRRSSSGAVETSSRECEHPSCSKQGKFRAPKSPDQLDEYHWFCREHVRKYNLQWNFFKGQTEEEVERRLRSDSNGKSKGTKFNQQPWQRHGINDPFEILGDKGTKERGAASSRGRRLTPSERRALAVLDANQDWEKSRIRKQYRALVKCLHPDLNGGDRSDENRLTEVVWAWDQIKDSRNFSD